MRDQATPKALGFRTGREHGEGGGSVCGMETSVDRRNDAQTAMIVGLPRPAIGGGRASYRVSFVLDGASDRRLCSCGFGR